ncbi:MAG: hypothetical protein OEZ51_15150, partial [Nitrospinota bacterium]|nr:hypothetical protein [Nitrospinota bacterium]
GDSNAPACASDPGTSRAAKGLTDADATTITFRANTEGISTNADYDQISPNATSLLVPQGSAAPFSVGDTVVFFNAEKPCEWNAYSISSKLTITEAAWQPNPGKIHDAMLWGGGNKNDFAFLPIEDNVAVVLNQYHTYTLTFDSVNQRITQSVDGAAAVPLANKISNLTFSYFDAAGNALTSLPLNATDLGDVRRIRINLTTVDDDDPSLTSVLITDVNLRNMGT